MNDSVKYEFSSVQDLFVRRIAELEHLLEETQKKLLSGFTI
jgi:hypothetical protein